jgi:hypothetical protein
MTKRKPVKLCEIRNPESKRKKRNNKKGCPMSGERICERCKWPARD